MEVDYAATQSPRLKKLTPDERKKLMDEGRCFKCRLKGHQARNCSGMDQTNNPNNRTSNARVANTPSTKGKETTAATNKDDPPPYDENQIAGLIRTMTTKQKETLFSKIASTNKGKEREESHKELSYQSDDEEGF
jgi:hypothetical protein